jgi:ribosome biogenesis protein ENP2
LRLAADAAPVSTTAAATTAKRAAPPAGSVKPGGVRELTFLPDPDYAARVKAERKAAKKAAHAAKSEAATQVGAGLRKGAAEKAREEEESALLEGEAASGRTRRRKVGRSASKTAMRTMGAR